MGDSYDDLSSHQRHILKVMANHGMVVSWSPKTQRQLQKRGLVETATGENGQGWRVTEAGLKEARRQRKPKGHSPKVAAKRSPPPVDPVDIKALKRLARAAGYRLSPLLPTS